MRLTFARTILMRQLLLLLAFLPTALFAQRISGTVYTDRGDLLDFASITVKNSKKGTSANNKARYSLTLPPGTYTIICQHIGYATQEKTITLGKADEVVDFILAPQKLTMKEVEVKTGAEDPAYAIIREAIKKRPYYNSQVNGFTCDLYTKDMIRLLKLPNKMFGQKIEESDRKDMGLDSTGQGIVYLAESVAKVSAQQPDKFKMEVKSSRVSGSDGFGFTFPTFISLYRNNVIIFTERLNPRGFVSPIADGAIGFYKFKYLGSFWENGKEVNSIRVTPRRQYEPLFTGIINITDGDWRIHSTDLFLTKKAQLEIIDTLHLIQMHAPAQADVWRVKNQLIKFNFKQFGINAAGNFLSVFSDFDVNPAFARNYFDRVIIAYDTAVNKRPKTYWDSIRPVPLEKEEQKDYQVKDSMMVADRDSANSKVTIDSLRKAQGKIKPWKALWGGIYRTRYAGKKTFNWGINPIIPQTEYNTAEGLVLQASGYYSKYFSKSKSTLRIEPHLRYGFSNTRLNAWADITWRTRDDDDGVLKRYVWRLSGGQNVVQFNSDNPITPLFNTITTLFQGDNFLKNYQRRFVSLGYSNRYESGFQFSTSLRYEDRLPMNNTTDFVFRKRNQVNLTPNYPFEKINTQFDRHQALLFGFEMNFRPGQRYIQFPRTKIPIGSKYPLFTLQYTKGINGLLGSDVHFDKWRFTISDDKNFKLAGTTKYRVSVGGFLNRNTVFIQDFQHFNGNQTLAASPYVNSFQLASYYANSTDARFYALAHWEHHFNGLLTNKIPLFRRLNWNLVAGTNAFYVNRNSNYVEVFAGLENIFKIFRVDVVSSFQEGKYANTGVRIGAGGLIGGAVSTSRGSEGGRTMTIRF